MKTVLVSLLTSLVAIRTCSKFLLALRNSYFARCLFYALLSVAAIQSSQAWSELYDDTDIYFSSKVAAPPNILVIIDSSGSMNKNSDPEQPYKASTTYPSGRAPYNIYDPNKFYYSAKGSEFSAKLEDTRKIEFAADLNHCQAAQTAASNSAGFYSDSYLGLASFDEDLESDSEIDDGWKQIGTSSAPIAEDDKRECVYFFGGTCYFYMTNTVSFSGTWRGLDCATDRGAHGNNTSNSTQNPYLSNGTGISNTGETAGSISSYWRNQTAGSLLASSYQSATLFSGNYLNWYFATSSTTRMQQAIEAFEKFVDSDAVYGRNIGLASFQEKDGGYIAYPLSLVNTNQDQLKAAARALRPAGATPLGGSLYEVLRYLRGDAVKFGKSNFGHASHPLSVDNNSFYRPPSEELCSDEKTHIILMTDGAPQADASYYNEITNYLNTHKSSPAEPNYDCGPQPPEDNLTFNNGKTCLTEVAKFLGNANIARPEQGFNHGVVLHTIAFALTDPNGLDILKKSAEFGKGGYYEASNATSLLEKFSSIVVEIDSNTQPSAAPSTPASASSRFSNSTTAYLNLFQASSTDRWDGNLKSYYLRTTTIAGQIAVEMVDGISSPQARQPVLNSAGLLKNTAQSRWPTKISSDTVADGSDVTRGGTRGQLIQARTVRLTVGNSAAITIINSSTVGIGRISAAQLGARNNAERDKIVRWLLGIQSVSPVVLHNFIADPLHSAPTVVRYATSGTEKEIAFYSTNLGLLHAIDTSSGAEESTWMPDDLLKNVTAYYRNVLSTKKIYGLDGSARFWHLDTNNNRLIDSGETALLFIGMRRGGSNYYAVDISNYKLPKLKWKIKGGAGGTTGFTTMGQSWSDPILRKVKFGGTAQSFIKDVLFFTGGYDPAQDRPTVESGYYTLLDNKGRGLYMIEALTGKLLWSRETSAGASVPASPAVVDINGDGLSDLAVTVDAAGRVRRYDFKNGAATAALFSTSTLVADLTQDTAGVKPSVSSSNRRHFFVEPILSIAKASGAKRLNIIIGSGRRPDLKAKELQDRLYVLRQENIYEAPDSSYKTIRFADLIRVNLQNFSSMLSTTSLSPTVTQAASQAIYLRDKGYYIDLGQDVNTGGERIISKPTVFGGTILLATYVPHQDLASSGCNNSIIGSSRLYAIQLGEGGFSQVFIVAQSGPPPDLSIYKLHGQNFLNLQVQLSSDKAGFANLDKNCTGANCIKLHDASSFIRFWIERGHSES